MPTTTPDNVATTTNVLQNQQEVETLLDGHSHADVDDLLVSYLRRYRRGLQHHIMYAYDLYGDK